MGFLQDLRRAIRSLGRNPGFAITAAAALTLGIGANTAMFSIIHGVLLAPLPYPDSARIVAVSTFWPETGKRTPRVTGGDFVDLRKEGRIFEACAYYFGGEVGVQLAGRAEFTRTFWVTPEFFSVFGVQPVYGRVFEAADHEQAALISRGLAERNFGSAQAALGRDLSAENRTYKIAGVLAAEHRFPSDAQVWVPAPETPTNLNRTAYNYGAIAKLKAGVPIEAANAGLDSTGARLAQAYPASNARKSFRVETLRDRLGAPVQSTLFFLMGAAGLVLLIACTNVADLMLARSATRSRETAVRTALGAGRWHVVRPLLAESAVLAATGGISGLLLAALGSKAFLRIFAAGFALPRLDEIQLDRPVLAFVTAVSLLAGVLFGLAPAWRAGRVDLQDSLRQGGSRGLVGGGSARVRNLLVVSQIALSFVLAAGAGVLLRSFYELTAVKLGYRSEGILVMYAHDPANKLEEYLAAGRLFERLLGNLSTLPGVTSVGAAMGLPTGQYGSNGSFAVEGKHVFGAGQQLPQAGFRLASPGYFATMGIPLIRGREFDARDLYDAPFVAIVSESLARQVFPNEDPIGRRVECGLDVVKWMTIVGIAGDVHQDSPASTPGPELYMPLQQHPYHANELQVVVRASVPPASLTAAVRDQVRALNPEIATKFTTMETMVSDSIARPRLRMVLIGSFALLALVLAMIGVYGVMSYLITQRTSEFGLRVALGAMPRDVVKLVLSRALRLAAAGLGIGLVLALSASRLVSSMVFGVKPSDAPTLLVVLVAVTAVLIPAAAIPAWRAARIDPLTALREE